jgi:murein DD-endopeptidase MepM/ murein hydrolase activator NlpD
MKTKLFSPLLSAANNIVKTRRPLTKRAKEYDAFINWLDTSNKDVKKIKLPKVKKVEDLEFSIVMSGGGGNGLTNLLLGGSAGLGVRFLGKGLKAVKGFGKNTISKIFPKLASQAEKKAAVPAANIARKGVVKGWEHIATGAPRAVASGIDDAAKVAAMKGGGKLAEKGAGLASKLIPGLATVVNLGTSAYRFSQGDVVGGSLSLASAIPILGWAAVGVDVAREFGAFEGTPFGLKKEKPKNKLDARLKAQEKKQIEAASASNVTFVSITNKFDKVVSKFEKIKFGVSGVQNKDNTNEEIEDSDSIEPTDPIDTGNKPEPTGLQLEDVEASGGEVPGRPNSPFGQKRGNRIHQGNDYFKSAGTPISLIQEGTVAVADMNYDPGGWGAVVEVRHRDGSLSRYAHLSKISVAAGSKITPGQVIGYTGGAAGAPGAGNSRGEHLHFEYLPAGSGQVDPTEAAKRIFRFGGNVKVKAKKKEQSQSQTPSPPPSKSPPKSPSKSPVNPSKLNASSSKLLDAALKGDTSVPGVYNPNNPLKRKGEKIKEVKPRSKAQIAPAQIPQISKAITNPLPQQASGPTIILGQSQASAQPSMVPVPIPMGGGGRGSSGEVAVITPSEGQILNSLWQLAHLTKLSQA